MSWTWRWWPERSRAPHPDLPEDVSEDLAAARRARAAAALALRETRIQGREVRQVARNATRIRAENSFSTRMTRAITEGRGDIG